STRKSGPPNQWVPQSTATPSLRTATMSGLETYDVLVTVGRKRRHDVNSFPNFIVLIDAFLLPQEYQFSNKFRIADTQFVDIAENFPLNFGNFGQTRRLRLAALSVNPWFSKLHIRFSSDDQANAL